MPDDTVTLGATPPTIEQIARVARSHARVALDAGARARLDAERAIVERLAASGAPIYGLTTGLGAAVDTRLDTADLAAFQRRAVRARAVGVGPALEAGAVRAAMAVRAAQIAAGGSGASPALLDALVAALNARVHPVVPASGSIGAADLAPLAHVALALIGEGEAERGGRRLPAAAALAEAGLAPLALGPKDGLALINSNAASVGAGALALDELARSLGALDVAAALSFEAFRANPTPLDARVVAARPAPGQEAAAARLRRLLAGSALFAAGAPRRVQDPLSLRCVAPVHGAARAALDAAREALAIELAGGGENPLLLPRDGELLSTANFDVTALTLAFEALGLALALAAGVAARRTMQLMRAEVSGLPRFLAPQGGSQRTGFATLQKTLSALDAEIRHRAQPASLGTLAVADGVEDHAGMLPLVIEKTGAMAPRLDRIAGAELMVAAHALDLRGDVALGPTLAAVRAAIRGAVPEHADDRPTGTDVEALAGLVASGEIARAAGL